MWLQGYLVGNGVTDVQVDGNALPLFAMGKSLISVDQYTHLVKTCGGQFWNATEGECKRCCAQVNF